MRSALFVAVPATAQATLVFSRNPLNPSVWSAADNGSGPHRLAPGSNPRISPNGQIVAFLHQGQGRSSQPELMLAPANGSAPASGLATGWREPFVFAWSPDSSSVAAVLGPEIGPKRLVLINVVTGAQQTVAHGFFSGVSFAPEGGQLVYSREASESFPPRSDVYRFDIPVGETLRAAQPFASPTTTARSARCGARGGRSSSSSSSAPSSVATDPRTSSS